MQRKKNVAGGSAELKTFKKIKRRTVEEEKPFYYERKLKEYFRFKF